jgi:hypothetical protein
MRQFVTQSVGKRIVNHTQVNKESMLPPNQHKAYCNFYDTVRDEEHLDARTTAMIGLAAAMARECQP